jgi:hypothetical protein
VFFRKKTKSHLKKEAAGSSEKSEISTRPHSIAAHKRLLFTVTDMRTSNPLVCSGQKYPHTPNQVKFRKPLVCEMIFKNNGRLVTGYYLFLIQLKKKEIQF